MNRGDLEAVRSHFARQGLLETALESKIRSKPRWYGIVDGNFRHQVVLLLMDTIDAQKNFCWMATIVRSGFSMQWYCQLAINHKLRPCPKLYVQSNFADILYNPRTEYDSLKLKEHRVTASMVADEFSGYEKYGSASFKQTARTAISLLVSIVKTIRKVANNENPELCLSSNFLNKFQCKSAVDHMKVVNCRPFH